jgi:hypothetical protein
MSKTPILILAAFTIALMAATTVARAAGLIAVRTIGSSGMHNPPSDRLSIGTAVMHNPPGERTLNIDHGGNSRAILDPNVRKTRHGLLRKDPQEPWRQR